MKYTIFLLLFNLHSIFAQKSILIKNANIIPIHMDTILKGYDVIVTNGIITDIYKSKKRNNKKNEFIIDATNQYLIPGLADMHVHIPRQTKYGYGADEFLKLQLAAGVTHLRSMRGADADLVIQREAAQKTNPDIYTSAPPFYAGRVWIRGDSLQKLLKNYQSQGYQSLKVLSVPSVAWFDTLAQLAQDHGFKLSGHVPNGISIAHTLSKGLNSIEHLGGYENLSINSPELSAAIEQTKNRQVYNCPTLDWYFVNYTQVPYNELKKRPGLDRLPTGLVTSWTKIFDDYFAKQAQKHPDSLRKEQQLEKEYVEKKLIILKQLHQQGCKLLVSPDASTVFQVPGLAMIEEMKWYKKAGIPEYNILRAATLNAAEYMGEANQWGSIQKNKVADLVLLDANPLDDIENLRKIKGVMKRGQWFSVSQINELIQTCKQNYREQP